MKYYSLTLFAVSALVAGGQVATAQSADPDVTRGSAGRAENARGAATTLSKSDQKFLTEAAQSSLAEIESGKLVAQRASRPDVKEFATRMVADHQKSYGELSMLAERKGFALPTSQSRGQQNAFSKLAERSAGELDKSYVENQVEAHEHSIEIHREAAENADDNDVRAAAAKHLPKLQQHMQTIKGLDQALD